MPTTAGRRHPFAPNVLERLLAVGSIVLLCVVLTAIARGHAHWGQVPPLLWLHLVTIGVGLALTPLMLLRPRGDRLHRRIGWVWAIAMFATAAMSFGIRLSPGGAFSPIHILSAVTVLAVPWMVWNARRHRVAKHRRTAQALVLGALLIAGFFTFPFGRMLGRWLLG